MLSRRRVASRCAAQSLAECAGVNVDAVSHTTKLRCAATIRANKTDRVRIIDHHQRLVFIGQRADAVEIGNDAVHREHPIGCDHLVARPGSISELQLRFEIRHIVVAIAKALCLAQAHTIDDAGVVEFIADHRIFLAQQRFEQTTVGIKARSVENRVLGAQKCRDRGFEVAMARLGAANEAYRGHAETEIGQTAFGGGNQARIIGKTQIIVGAKIDDFRARLQTQRSLLWCCDQPFALEKSVHANLFQRRVDVSVESLVHL